MTLHAFPDVEQGTEEWHDQRRGMVTASVVASLLSVGKLGAIGYGCPACSALANDPCVSKRGGAGPAKPIKALHPERAAVAEANRDSAPLVIEVADNDTSRGLTRLLTAERITGWTDPTYVSDDMWRGVEDEPRAREAYAKDREVEVVQMGFMVRDDWGFEIGLSPDGLVGDDGLIEIKSRRAKKQLETVLVDEVPAENMAQIQCALLVSGREWCDYVSFTGGMPLWTKRVTPDEQWQKAIVDAVAAFEKASAEMTNTYLTRVEGLPMTERVVDNNLGLVFD